MRRISLSLFACVVFSALAISGAPAVHAASIAAAALVATNMASNQQTSTSRSTSANSKHAHALTRAARKARKPSKERPAAPAPRRVVANKASNRNSGPAQNAVQGESNARAERLYRASQFSAPIIIDAKACKRVGAHGESIYENC